ncbi:hypothetical protein NL676_035433 [Syzygium grande]|nr:hypothetical protein NL676_035433 [Syzygium grande]
MGKLQPTSSNTDLEPAPSWDADPSSPPSANATTDPPLPDSLSTDLPQTRDSDSDDHEKTSTSPPPSPKPIIPPPPLLSHVDPEPSAPLPPKMLHHPDDIQSMQAVSFPPARPVAVATARAKRLCLTCLLKIIATKRNGPTWAWV